MPSTRILALAAFVAALLAACGGGTSQYDPFVPGRVLAFGDENSVIDSQGRKYSINGVTAAQDENGQPISVPDCTAYPNWAQSVASFYGFVFAECNPSNVEPRARMLARPGARVADLKLEIDALVSTGGFRENDMATVMVGQNDILDLYAQYPNRTADDVTNAAADRGRQLAAQVNRLVGFGAKVIVATLPDVGITPFAAKQRLEFNDTDRAALLTRMTAAFNEQLGVNIILDGRFIGLAWADLRLKEMTIAPGNFGLSNTTTAACLETSPPPDCNTTTLVDGAGVTTWMWADDLHMGYTAQSQIAVLALDRARGNPF
jgi:outer membrane lipase/esterase